MFGILVVDDEPLIRRGLKTIIHRSSRDFKVTGEAADGKEALSVIECIKPEVIISDVRMPEMDGLELCRIVKEKYSDIIFVILSGYDDFKYAQQAIKYGVYDYILKPINTKELIKLLDKIYQDVQQINIEKNRKKYLDMNIAKDISLLFLIAQQNDLIFNIKIMDKNNMHKAVENIFDYIQQKNIDIANVRHFSTELVSIILNEFSIKYLQENKQVIQEKIQELSSVISIKNYLIKTLSSIIDYLIKYSDSNNGKIVDKIKKYINDNYYTQISLKSLSEKFYLNPCYLSDLFKSHSGENFIDYLTKIRIQKSIQLLKDPRLKIKEIAQMVGYKNPKYYSKLFKDTTGLTPAEYRNRFKS